MDLFSENRSLVYRTPVLRRGRSGTGLTTAWSDLVAALLDNYCKASPASGSLFRYITVVFFLAVILMREEKRPNCAVKRIIVSRVRQDFIHFVLESDAFVQPIPLAYLRLGIFNSPPETRREKVEDGGLLEGLRHQTVQIYPFTIYHASNQSKKYTLHVTTAEIRQRWYAAFVDAIGVRKVWQDANMVCSRYLVF